VTGGNEFTDKTLCICLPIENNRNHARRLAAYANESECRLYFVLTESGYNTKRYLVTGCTGFIGRHIVRFLNCRGSRIRGLSRQPPRVAGSRSIELFEGDLSRPDTLQGAAENIDTIIHAAGLAHAAATGPPGIHSQITLEGTRHLLAEAEKCGVQCFIFISSIKAASEPGTGCLDETATGFPLDEYGLSRRRAEELILEAGHRTGMHVCILRPALVYGPGCKGNLAGMLRWIDRGLFPPIPDTGNRRSMVDVRDLVHAVMLAVENEDTAGRTYFITDGEDYTTRRIYTAMCRALGKSVPKWSVPVPILRALGRVGDAVEAVLGRPVPYDSRTCSRLLDSACYRSVDAASSLGFHPAYTLEDALPAMVKAYRQTAHPER
jgi:UDP-glucose 4-epimerase